MRLPAFTLLLLILFPIYCFASVEVLGNLKYTHKSKPGEIVKGQIRIMNSDSTDQEVKVYQTDLLYNMQEQTFYDDPKLKLNKRSNADWIQYSPKSLVLKANETRTIDYEISVPQNDSIIGTYWSIFMIEGIDPINPNSLSNISIHTVTRYAIQIVNEINNEGTGSIKFMPPTLFKEEKNTLFLAVDLLNDGDHYISPVVKMEVYDESGEFIKTITANRRGLYPTTSARYKLNLEGIPPRKTYSAIIMAVGQENDVFGIEYTLYF